ncbi:MAG: hypothetical protein Q7R49_04395 [Candidatus Daviesbacteria bacterium]|nr:hypothetical protein [Candidatus Daviesbacteria bacterium]
MAEVTDTTDHITRSPNKEAYLLPEYGEFKGSDLPTVAEVLVAGQAEIASRFKPDNLPITDGDIERLVTVCLDEINRIESAARNPQRWEISPAEAAKTRLIIDFSAPGTYFLPFKDDRYKDKPWAILMDRRRADTSAILGIVLAGILTKEDYSIFTKYRLLNGLNPELANLRPGVRENILKTNLQFLYLGTPQEATAINKVLHSAYSFVPPEAVTVVDSVERHKIDNTIDQVKAIKEFFDTHTDLFQDGDIVDFVLGPQAVRVLRMCAQFKAIPNNLKVQVFPESTPKIGVREYATNESKAAIYYAVTKNASIEPHPFEIIGDNKLVL